MIENFSDSKMFQLIAKFIKGNWTQN